MFPDKVFKNLIRKPHGNPEKTIRFYLKSFSGFHYRGKFTVYSPQFTVKSQKLRVKIISFSEGKMDTKSDAIVEVQAREDLPEVYIDDMLMSIKYFTDEQEIHLQLVNVDACVTCDKPCLFFCPVGAYQVQEDGHVIVAFQSCIECGSCRLMCPHNNVNWKYPRGGFGVSYKFG